MAIDSKIILTCEKIKKLNLLENCNMDSLDVVEKVSEIRNYWKPTRGNVKVILLAESHVHTTDDDFKVLSNKSILLKRLPGYPLEFVRFVYCLGSGEDELLNGNIKNNRGTRQFWKILYSCCNKIDSNSDFGPILKKTPFNERIINKIKILENLRERGIWLLDSSIIGIAKSKKGVVKTRPNKGYTKKIINICWENYTKHLIEESKPRYIIVIGKGVYGTLCDKLSEMGFSGYEGNLTVIEQPQARLEGQQHLDNLKEIYKVCSMSFD